MGKIKEYKKEDLTVIWEASKCIHSENCWRGLSSVFDPKSRPWIDVEGASSEAIMNQIDKCPSKALRYRKDGDENVVEESMEKPVTQATIIKDGPLMIEGNLTLTHVDGRKEDSQKLFLCRCGASSNKPYCDGSHKKVDFKD